MDLGITVVCGRAASIIQALHLSGQSSSQMRKLNSMVHWSNNVKGIIENCEDRFPDEEVAEIVELVTKTLPPPPVKTKPEEITEGNEETTVKHEKGNEISEEQNEGGEQMDTS